MLAKSLMPLFHHNQTIDVRKYHEDKKADDDDSQYDIKRTDSSKFLWEYQLHIIGGVEVIKDIQAIEEPQNAEETRERAHHNRKHQIDEVIHSARPRKHLAQINGIRLTFRDA